MDVVGKTYASYVGNSHSANAKRGPITRRDRTQSGRKTTLQLWEVPKGTRAITGKFAEKKKKQHSKKKQGKTAEVWVRPTTPTGGRKPKSKPKKNIDAKPKQQSRPVSASGYMKKQKAKKPAAARKKKVADADLIPNVKVRVPDINVDNITDEELLAIKKRIRELEIGHKRGNQKSNALMGKKFEKTKEYMKNQVKRGDKNAMLLFGAMESKKGQNEKETRNTMIKLTAKDIVRAKQNIEKQKELFKGMKDWNKKDRELWELKMKVEMAKLIKAKGRDPSPPPKRRVEPATSAPIAAKGKTQKPKSTKGSRKPNVNVPWDTSLPFNVDGTVERLNPEELKKAKEPAPKKSSPLSMTNPLKLMEHDANATYVTDHKCSYGAFYNDPAFQADRAKAIAREREKAALRKKLLL